MDVIAVIGLGYIGLPTASALASHGLDVIGVDVDPEVVAAVNRGEAHLVEPDLAEVLRAASVSGRLTATENMPKADIYIIAVPTPITPDRRADLTYVEAATRALAPKLAGGELVILESTSPPGTTEQISRWIAGARPDLAPGAVQLAHCPERVLPGRVMIELVENDRVVGGLSPAAAERAAELYRTFCKGRIVLTDVRTAELSKLVENAYRDLNIAFANELSLVADHLGVNVRELIEIANHHPRVDILDPGPGVGGHCIAVDPWFIVQAAPEQANLVRAARQINDARPGYIVQQVLDLVSPVVDPVIAVLGLSFKKNIDDLRSSPAVEITIGLADALPRSRLLVVEPHVVELPESLRDRSNIEPCDLRQAVQQSQAVVLLVDHDVFASITPEQLAGKSVCDTRGMWQPIFRA